MHVQELRRMGARIKLKENNTTAIDRGYEQIEEKLQSLGANIRRNRLE